MLRSSLDGKPEDDPVLVLRLLDVDYVPRVEGCKHAKDGCTASHVQYDLVLEDVLVLVDSIAIRLCPYFVFLKSQVSVFDFNRIMRWGRLITYQHFFVYA